MQRKNISYLLQMKIREYLRFLWQEEYAQHAEKEHEIINSLSRNLKEELLLEAYGRTLKKIPLFFANFSDNTLKAMVYKMSEVRFSPQDIIFSEKVVDDCDIFILVKGKIDYIVSESMKRPERRVIRTLKLGDVFGEISFFTGESRSGTYISRDFTSCYSIKRADFLSILKEFPDDYEKFCWVRDKICIENNIDFLQTRCFGCKQAGHYISNCTRLHYIPDKDFLIKVHNHNTGNKDRAGFIRKKFRFNALANKKDDEPDNLKKLESLFRSINYVDSFENNQEMFESMRINVTKPEEENPMELNPSEFDQMERKPMELDPLEINPMEINPIFELENESEDIPKENEIGEIRDFPMKKTRKALKPVNSTLKRKKPIFKEEIKSAPLPKSMKGLKILTTGYCQKASPFLMNESPTFHKGSPTLKNPKETISPALKTSCNSPFRLKAIENEEKELQTFERVKNYNNYFNENNIRSIIKSRNIKKNRNLSPILRKVLTESHQFLKEKPPLKEKTMTIKERLINMENSTIQKKGILMAPNLKKNSVKFFSQDVGSSILFHRNSKFFHNEKKKMTFYEVIYEVLTNDDLKKKLQRKPQRKKTSFF